MKIAVCWNVKNYIQEERIASIIRVEVISNLE
jgi:hypothetical protein